MRAFFAGLLVGAVVGAGGLWMLQAPATVTVPRSTDDVQRMLDAKLEALELQAGQVRAELAETGRVIRRRARAIGGQLADAASDARTTAAVKARLAADPQLSALAISVSTTDGVVTLSGRVASPELVGRAVVLALEAEGTREVISTLRVESGGV